MSIKLMSLAFATPYPATPKLILLSLCDYADDTGASFPSLATLEKKASCGKSTQSYHIRTFEQIGILKKEKRNRPNGSRASSIYYINVELLEKNAIVFKKVTSDEQKSHQKNINQIKKAYEKAYKNIRPSSQGEQYPLVHMENNTIVLHETPPSSPCEHLEPSLYNHHYINLEEDEEDISLDLTFVDNYVYHITEGYKGVRRKNQYTKKVLTQIKKGDKTTIEAYKSYLSTLPIFQNQNVDIKSLSNFKLNIQNKIYECYVAQELENLRIEVTYQGVTGDLTHMILDRKSFFKALVA